MQFEGEHQYSDAMSCAEKVACHAWAARVTCIQMLRNLDSSSRLPFHVGLTSNDTSNHLVPLSIRFDWPVSIYFDPVAMDIDEPETSSGHGRRPGPVRTFSNRAGRAAPYRVSRILFLRRPSDIPTD